MGVFGPMVIHGPATANYDEELEPIMLIDWTHETVDALWHTAQTSGPPPLDTALINGKGTYEGVGERYEMAFQAGNKYRLRFINAAIDTHFKLSLDGHKMTVIAMDFVPVVPFEVDVLDITMGMFTANPPFLKPSSTMTAINLQQAKDMMLSSKQTKQLPTTGSALFPKARAQTIGTQTTSAPLFVTLPPQPTQQQQPGIK